jgi:hypothetical protein
MLTSVFAARACSELNGCKWVDEGIKIETRAQMSDMLSKCPDPEQLAVKLAKKVLEGSNSVEDVQQLRTQV